MGTELKVGTLVRQADGQVGRVTRITHTELVIGSLPWWLRAGRSVVQQVRKVVAVFR